MREVSMRGTSRSDDSEVTVSAAAGGNIRNILRQRLVV